MLDRPDTFTEDNSSNSEKEKDSIDEIFIKITELYSPVYIELLNNIFKLAKTNQEHYKIYITGINTLMEPINCQLNKWIESYSILIQIINTRFYIILYHHTSNVLTIYTIIY